MRSTGVALLVAAALLAGLASPAALAHGRHGGGHVRGHIGLYIGGPLWWGPRYYYPPYYYPSYGYYYPPAYYYPPVVAAPASPPVYVERGDAQAGADDASNWWYYCANPQGYYPYVKHCSGGWQRVAPQPPPSQ